MSRHYAIIRQTIYSFLDKTGKAATMEDIVIAVTNQIKKATVSEVRHCVWMLVARDQVRYYVSADDRYLFEVNHDESR